MQPFQQVHLWNWDAEALGWLHPLQTFAHLLKGKLLNLFFKQKHTWLFVQFIQVVKQHSKRVHVLAFVYQLKNGSC